MVSPLSTRLFNLEAKASSINLPPFAKLKRQEWQKLARVKRISGYSADKESARSSGIYSMEKQMRANIVGMTAKKRKIDELHYQAATARSTLGRGDNSSTRSQTRRPSALPHGSIDTNAVKLITVSRNNPYTQEIPAKNEDEFDLSIYSEMVQSCKQFYNIHGLTPLINDTKNSIPNQEESIISCDATDSTKSNISSDTDSDDGTLVGIPARFEDYNQKDDSKYECEEVDNFEKNALKDAIHLSAVCSSSLEEAFATQSSARLITGPKQPYMILHANAAFSQLSGISSDNLIGRPLNKIMSVPKTPSKLSTKDSVLVSLKDIESTNLPKASISALTCEMKTAKVYSGTKMTHFSIDVEKSSGVDTYKNFITVTG